MFFRFAFEFLIDTDFKCESTEIGQESPGKIDLPWHDFVLFLCAWVSWLLIKPLHKIYIIKKTIINT